MPDFGEQSGPGMELELSDAALVRMASGGDRLLIDESILDGPGVDPAVIEAFKEVPRRLTGYPSILDYQTYPRDRNGPTYQFFEGEDFQYNGGVHNETNNPLHLIRPRSLAKPYNLMRYGAGKQHGSGPSNFAQSRQERGYDDDQIEWAYVRAVAGFEEVFIAVLESTNLPDRDEAGQFVQNKLAEVFEKNKLGPGHPERFNEYQAPLERPAGWLVHAVLSTVFHEADVITPAARVRALGLLQAYPIEELHEGFTSGGDRSYRSVYSTGLLEGGILPRLPHTLASPNERHLDRHENWLQNPVIAPIVERIRSNDHRTATNTIISRPQEAIQLALLLLQESGTQAFGLGLLREIPEMGRKTQALMFGARATFYLDNAISNTLEDQIAQGAGTRFDPTLDFDGLSAEMLENASPGELQQFLAAALLRLRRAEELAASLAGGVPQGVRRGRQDPDGHLAALGIRADLLDRYNDDELDILIKGAYRTMSRVTHPDQGGKGERQRKLNDARDFLLKPDNRRGYGLPSGPGGGGGGTAAGFMAASMMALRLAAFQTSTHPNRRS